MDADATNTRLPPVSILISPPEAKPYDSFSEPSHHHLTSKPSPLFQPPIDSFTMAENKLPPIRGTPQQHPATLPSPPISPWTSINQKRQTSPAPSSIIDSRDPPLFPHSSPLVTSDEPLFPPEPADFDGIVARHVAQVSGVSPSTRPTNAEYKLALTCKSIVLSRYNENPRAWLREERRILKDGYPNMQRIGKPMTTAFPKLAHIAPAPPLSNGIRRPTATTARGGPRVSRVSSSPRMPKQRNSNGTPSPKTPAKQHNGAGRVIGTSREDVDFNALPDYAPSSDALPANANILKADWKGQVLDLSSDPHRHLLHDAEVKLAASLRLSCATYLCSKRRIFMGRVEALKIGKEFRKTDAQQACKIDVNKASKLWTAYDKVGWFHASLFRQFIAT